MMDRTMHNLERIGYDLARVGRFENPADELKMRVAAGYQWLRILWVYISQSGRRLHEGVKSLSEKYCFCSVLLIDFSLGSRRSRARLRIHGLASKPAKSCHTVFSKASTNR
jgi:hypothetical protein